MPRRIFGKFLSTLVLGTMAFSGSSQAAPVLMVSIDGLRAGDVVDADKRGIHLPTLKRLMAEGAYATGVRNVLPTLTYPDHTTLITGVWPAVHGIASNQTFDPLSRNMNGYYWYSSDIKVGTLWDAVHQAGGKVANLFWPVSVGSPSIDYNLPEYWRADSPDDIKLLRVLSSPDLVPVLEKATGRSLAEANGKTAGADAVRTRFAAAMISTRHPQFLTVHLRAVDAAEHAMGPGSRAAIAALEQLDRAIGGLVADARKSQPDMVVAVVSDHGFAPLQTQVNLIKAFADAGLITFDPTGKKLASWEAAPWGSASSAVVLARPHDPLLKAKVAKFLRGLAANPANGIDHVADVQEIARLGGTTDASFWIDFKPGFSASANNSAPAVSPSNDRGIHGYFPTHPEMRAAFIISGAGIPKRGPLGEIDMRDIAPTLAKIMNVRLPQAAGRPLF